MFFFPAFTPHNDVHRESRYLCSVYLEGHFTPNGLIDFYYVKFGTKWISEYYENKEALVSISNRGAQSFWWNDVRLPGRTDDGLRYFKVFDEEIDKLAKQLIKEHKLFTT